MLKGQDAQGSSAYPGTHLISCTPLLPKGPLQTLIYIFHLRPQPGCGSPLVNQRSKQGRFREGEAEPTQVWKRASGGVQSPSGCQLCSPPTGLGPLSLTLTPPPQLVYLPVGRVHTCGPSCEKQTCLDVFMPTHKSQPSRALC